MDVARQAGWTQAGASRGVALVDLDNDGTLDVIVTHQFAPVSIYKHVGAVKSWVGIALEGNARDCNRDAIGTRVSMTRTGEGRCVKYTRPTDSPRRATGGCCSDWANTRDA